MFSFENLDASTRVLMLQELDRDLERDAIFLDTRLNSGATDLYLKLLRAALESGTGESFSEAIGHHHLLKDEETRQVGEKEILAKVPRTAHYTLGEGEFNRYYMRAICLRAIELGQREVEVYRAKPVQTPRLESENTAGTFKNARELLEQLRTTNISVARSFPGANSGKSLRLITNKGL